MNRLLVKSMVMAALLVCLAPGVVLAQSEDDKVQQLEAQIGELRILLEELRKSSDADARLDEIERQISVLAEEVENLKVGEAAITIGRESAMPGLGPAASRVYTKDQGVSIGGYGEMLLQAYDSSRDDGTPADKTDTFDFLRAVLYFGYKFSDSFVFNSEIEIEHASTSKSGSVSVEFAYLDYLHSDPFNLRAGLVLIPMGVLNELHEPTTYLGAVRPDTERRIIPSTWRENGIGVFGSFGGFDYRTYVVNGLDGSGFSASGLRGGRQKGSKARAEDFAWVGRADYTAVPGLMIGGSIYAGNSGQGLETAGGEGVDIPTLIFEGHVDYKIRGLQLRALYAQADLDDVAKLNEALGFVGNDSVGESMVGYYLEAGYDVFSKRSGRSSLIPYLRWEKVNTQESVPDGWQADPATETDFFSIGLAYQPIEQLIAKLEYRDVNNAADTGVNQVNFNIGYIF
jgi:hypothetical protein